MTKDKTTKYRKQRKKEKANRKAKQPQQAKPMSSARRAFQNV